jgi:hypothetical protein
LYFIKATEILNRMQTMEERWEAMSPPQATTTDDAIATREKLAGLLG